MSPEIAALQNAHDMLRADLRALQNKWYITMAVATALAALGVVLATFLFNTMTEFEKTKRDLVAATRDLELNKAQATKEIVELRDKSTKQVSETVYAALAASKTPTIAAWLSEERKQREAKDAQQNKWIRYIYGQANVHGETSPYANGWWQDSLKKGQQAVDIELP